MNLSLRTLAVIALLSGLATALIIHAGLARTAAQQDVLAALKHRETVTAVQQGETVVAIAPRVSTASAPQNVSPPAADTPPAAAASTSTTTSAATATNATTTTATRPTNVGLPKVGHVFVVSLSTSSLTAAFGEQSSATYLHSLLASGTLLSGYRSLGHGELADELALLSGQAPNRDTTAGCPRYVAFPQTATANAAGLVSGNACVYPDSVLSLADQVQNAGKQWGAYVDGMGSTPCPTPQTGGSEDAAISTAAAGYDTLHNPFIFFPSLTGSGECYLSEGDTTLLTPVLQRSVAATPELTYIAPNACADGGRSNAPGTNTTAVGPSTSDTPGTGTGTSAVAPETTASATATTTAATAGATTPTAGLTTTTSAGLTTPATTTAESSTAAGRDDVCAPGDASGITAENDFLTAWVPQILASKAYAANGVLVITFAGVTPPHGHTPFATGALVISRWTGKGKRITTAYDPYSMLHSLEDMLDLQPLGRAAGAPAFARRVLSAR
jgi:hypothetical protein